MKISKGAVGAALLAAALPLLQGCFPAVATGVAAGSLLIADRRVSENYLADEAIELRALGRINDRYGDKVHVNVTSYNKQVLLTGEVPDAATKEGVERLAREVPNVARVHNELQVAGLSSFPARSNDTFLTTKVKSRFVEANRFSPNHVKVVTEAGTVFLMGLVTPKEADAAVEIARTTGGVQKVVRIFEALTEEQARQLDGRPRPAKN